MGAPVVVLPLGAVTVAVIIAVVVVVIVTVGCEVFLLGAYRPAGNTRRGESWK